MAGRSSYVRILGFTVLEILVAGCIAGGLFAVILGGYLRMTRAANTQQRIARIQKEQLLTYPYFWKMLVHAGFAGRCNLRQLDLRPDGEEVWRYGIYGYNRGSAPDFLRHKGAASDILQVAGAVNNWMPLAHDLNPADEGQSIRVSRNLFLIDTERYLLVEDGERSEVVAVSRGLFAASACRYLHRASATRLYPLQRISFFVARNSLNDAVASEGERWSLYRVVGYSGRKEEILRGVSGLRCWFGVLEEGALTGHRTRNAPSSVRYYTADEITAYSLWSEVMAVKLELAWHGFSEPMILAVRLRNLDF